MRTDHRMQRLYCDSPIAAGESIEASPEQVHYLLHVLRLGAGDEVLIFNGSEGEWSAVLVPEGRRRLNLRPVRLTRPQPPRPDLLFCFAPLKSARLDYLVQKATEMGAGSIQPVITRHTQVHKPGEARLRANIVEAAEQCGLLCLPELKAPVSLARLLEDWDDGRRLVFCDEDAPHGNPLGALASLRGSRLGLIVGPEGGFSAGERGHLRGLPFVTPIGLGPRILRADTAAVAALAVVQAAAGDW
jgi:16S rRNA (uracil1498-N3)-methyltransferase